MADYDDYRPTSQLNDSGQDGIEITRTIYVRALDEVDAYYHPDVPRRGDALDAGEGSISITVYVKGIDVSQIAEAAGDDDGKFLFEVTTTYSPLQSGNRRTPVQGKAAWSVDFRPQSVNIKQVETDDDQEHYGPTDEYDAKLDEVTTGINVTDEGPQGIDVQEMVEVLTIDFWKDPDDVTDYLADVRGLFDKTNASSFEGPWGTYAAGEALITGFGVRQQADNIVTVRVEISRGKNLTTAGSGGDAPQVKLDWSNETVDCPKKGWQYLWVRYLNLPLEGSDDNYRPTSVDAHVATVYKEGDYSALGVSDDLWS